MLIKLCLTGRLKGQRISYREPNNPVKICLLLAENHGTFQYGSNIFWENAWKYIYPFRYSKSHIP